MMCWRNIIPALAIVVLSTGACQAQKAREYYDELYKAGGLDRMADGWVCFDEHPENQNFFIFAKSETLKEFLKENDGLKSLPQGSRAQLDKGFLFVRGYNKGVALGDGQDFYIKDGESWVSDPFRLGRGGTGRMRLRVSFETLRYRRSVEVTKDHVTNEAATTFGRCESISPDVRQKGN
jgi:hypothetical protein